MKKALLPVLTGAIAAIIVNVVFAFAWPLKAKECACSLGRDCSCGLVCECHDQD